MIDPYFRSPDPPQTHMADTISIPLDMWGQARSHIDRDEGSRITFTPSSNQIEIKVPKRCQTFSNVKSIVVYEEYGVSGKNTLAYGGGELSTFWASQAWVVIRKNLAKLRCVHCYFSGDLPSFMKPRIEFQVRIMLGPDTTDNIKVKFSFETVLTSTPVSLVNRIAQLEAFLYETKNMAARVHVHYRCFLKPYYKGVAMELQAQLEKLEEQVRGMNMRYILRGVGSVSSVDAGIYTLGRDMLELISTHVASSSVDKDYSTTEVLRRIPWSGK